MLTTSLALLALSAVTEAHFRLNSPYWRGDSFATGRSQWSWPCANVSQENSSTNRTAWPLDGGSLVYSSSHDWVITYVNLGLGDEVTGFNVSLIAALNVTGNGTFCLPQLGGSALTELNITEGQTASIQVVNVGHSGNALYNCADIVFQGNATLLSGDQCANSTGVSAYFLEDAASSTEHEHSEGGSATSSAATSSSTTGAGSSHRVEMGALVGAAAIAVGAMIA